MTRQIHPLEATEKIRRDYIRYLRTIYFLRDENLRKQLWSALEQDNFLVKGPILEAAPPFQTARSIHELVNVGVLHQDFRQICSEHLPWDRPLYLHQDQAIEKVVKQGRNVVIATGTGSGKTESFLMPVFDHLLRERQSVRLNEPGVRALLLYPMNALANDQLKRIRKVLANFPAITFGRYTGETPEDQSQAEARFHEQFPGEPLLPNELVSRERMRASPPHILMTNYAMLEYLLLRPKDTEFFDGETGRFWRFIVLDEVHTYDGAAGIEIAMLMRRLKDRVVTSTPGRIRYIATSATLGRGRNDYPAVAQFAEALFGETFEWLDADSARQDVVEGTREHRSQLGTPWGTGTQELYGKLVRSLEQNSLLPTLASDALNAGVPEKVVSAAEREARKGQDDADAVNRFLYHILSGDEYLHRLRSQLIEPLQLSQNDSSGNANAVINLVELGVRARANPDELSLIPARYHVFARALEGSFLCLNESAPQHAGEGAPRILLNRHEICPYCGARVFELATCSRCGTAYIVGREVQDGVRTLRHPPSARDDNPAGLDYFVLSANVQQPDEDEATAAGEQPEAFGSTRTETIRVCLKCGALSPEESGQICSCGRSAPFVLLQKVEWEPGATERCVTCGVRHSIHRFLTGQDAPVSVLATSLYQLLPPSEELGMIELPGQGRKLLAFADSRQDAAFFAPYLEQTYQRILNRRIILKTLLEDEDARKGDLRLEDLVPRVLRQTEAAGFFEISQSLDERRQKIRQWLIQEFIALDSRNGLEGLGLLHFKFVEPQWEPPAPLLSAPWNLSLEEARSLIFLLLNTLRVQGIVTFPPNIDPRDTAFEPRNVELFVSEFADSEKRVLGWLPKQGSNRRLDYLVRLLERRAGIAESEAKEKATEMLKGLWRYLSAPNSPWRTLLFAETRPQVGVVYRLDYRLVEWKPILDESVPVYRCNRCFNTSYFNIDDICPTNGCDGALHLIDSGENAWQENHYRHLYQNLSPIPLHAEEHTAQWTSTIAGQIQEKFIRGQVNVLSCSTTFELGVDVGALQAVLMRNVPPTTANYIQRAGRAGRRTDSVAFALTFAQRRSHDLSYFNNPKRLVAGRIQPPVVNITNEKIVRRHMHSVFLAAFLRWAVDRHGRSFAKVGDFFAQRDSNVPATELLKDYVHLKPKALQEALERIVPSALKPISDIPQWGWLRQLTDVSGDGILDKATQEVRNDLDLYARLEQEASSEKKYTQAAYFQRVSKTVQTRELLGFLASRNVLPKYGFPTDVVELRTQHIPQHEAQNIELDRDLRIAISEYAPGSEVVAAKRIWRGGGLYQMPGRTWQIFHYAICPECAHFHRSTTPLAGVCRVCGANLTGRGRQPHGRYIIPEFGFVASRETREVGTQRPQKIYATRVHFSEYAAENIGEQPTLEPIDALHTAGLQVSQRYSRYGKLAVVNPGILNSGFRVCSTCGWSTAVEPVAPGRRPRQRSEHRNPRTDGPCRGLIETFHLGHEFITDVLELRFTGTYAVSNDTTTWLSTLYALLEGASGALGIARDDLDGTLYPYQFGLAPALILFDNVPGGAGHVRRIAEVLPAVIQEAWKRVANCECGQETSCYECLRNFYNQHYHDQIVRGSARDLLGLLIDHN